MNEQNNMVATEAKIRMQPTIYTFNFKDIPTENYIQTLKVLFNNPDFGDAVQKRNRLVNTAGRIRPHSAEMRSLIRAIQQHDHKLADMLYMSLVQANLHSEVSYDFLSFSTLLKYYIDYSQEGVRDRVNNLACNLDRLTFLADMLESLVVDIKADMQSVFGGNIEFHQFDAVCQVLTQLRGFFNITRSKDANSPEAQLYMDYADSINEYLGKRLKTYTDKYRKFHPMPKVYTKQEMAFAIHQVFGIEDHLCESFIKQTETGGFYIDAVALAFNLNKEQTERLDSLVGKITKKQSTDAILTYCFSVTDAIMNLYSKK